MSKSKTAVIQQVCVSTTRAGHAGVRGVAWSDQGQLGA